MNHLAVLALVASASAAFSPPQQGSELYGWIFATSPTDQNDAGQRFRDEIFKKEPLHVSRAFNRSYYAETLPLQQLWPTLPENSTNLQSLSIKGNAIDVRVDGEKVSTSKALNKVLAADVLDHEGIPDKTSFILKFEELDDHGVAIEQLQQRFASDSARASSIHGYYSAAGGSKALHAHTDPYDVVILQIVGSKHWTMCVPPSNSTSQVSTAENAIQYAKDHADGKSCVSYNADTLKSLTCTNFVMEAGDALYLPRDVIHFAETGDSASVHLTIGLGGDHNEKCDEDNLDAFERDVAQQQRSRRSCTSSQSSYSTTYCDLSCDTSCDSCSSYTTSYSCSYYYYSCDSSCDSGCDLGCTSTSYYDDDYTYSNNYYYDDDDYSSGLSGATIGIICAAVICFCIIFCIPLCIICCAAAADDNPRANGYQNNNYNSQYSPPVSVAPMPPAYNSALSNSMTSLPPPGYPGVQKANSYSSEIGGDSMSDSAWGINKTSGSAMSS